MEQPVHEPAGAGEVASSDAYTFASLAMDLHDADGMEETVQAVVDFALEAVGCDHAAVALSTPGRPDQGVEVGAVSDPVVEELYRLQFAAGVGPLIDALRDRRVIAIPDATTEDRWPGWSKVMVDHDVRSVLHVPLAVSQRTIGVLSLYSARPDAFGDDDFAVAHILARHASIAVATARQEETMARAMDARKLVGAAMGILMVRYDIDLERAFEVLKRYSQHNNRKLRDVAAEVIETRALPPAK
jgi:GAF domain-containing protein